MTNCERPAREDDLKVVWGRDGESGEQVDARICAVCRAEQADTRAGGRGKSTEGKVALLDREGSR